MCTRSEAATLKNGFSIPGLSGSIAQTLQTLRAAVILNAAAAIYLSGVAQSYGDGVERAVSALDEKKGLAALERLREAYSRK